MAFYISLATALAKQCLWVKILAFHVEHHSEAY